ncbi:MAG: VOC family protein [Oscillospiraceae bacterium]
MDERTELQFSLGHVGINQQDDGEAKKTVALLGELFGFPARETDGSYFVNDQFEVMKMPFLGKMGHVAILTADVAKAKTYLEGKGIAFNESTANRNDEGKLMAIYFQDEIAGFAFHLKQN